MAVIQSLFNQNKPVTPSSGIQSPGIIQPIYNNQPPRIQIDPKQKKILPQSLQLIKKPIVKPQVIIPKNPIKKDEPGGLFEMVGNIAKNTLTVGSQAKDAIIKHFKEKAPITALLQGNPTEFVARTKATLKEYERQQREDPVNFALGFIAPGGGIFKGAKETVAKETTPTVVGKIVEALKEAKPLRGKQEALYSAERAKRVAKVVSVGKKVPGEKGFFAQLGQLKGELPKVEFESIRKNFQQTDIDDLFNMIEKNGELLPFEKITTKGGLAKLLGTKGGGVPTKNEIELMRQVFPEEMIKAILGKRPLSEKLLEGIGEVLNVPRALMASFDLSAPLRQGIFLVGRPKQFVPAFKEMFKYAFSDKAYQGLVDNIKTRSNYRLMREGKLALTDIGSINLTGREEAFMSNLAEKIPGIGKIVRGSNRAYTGFLNKLRADVFDDLVSKADNLGIEKSDKFIRDAAKFVNAATGRGDIGVLNKAAVVLNSTLFSPRLMASRLNLLNPIFYTSLDSLVRKEAIKSLLTFGATTGTVLSLAKLGGAEVGTDPRSADFGKIKVGNTRYDIMGGFQQYIKVASQLVSGSIISSTTGREITLGEGYKPLTRKDIILRFFESKESPIASFITGLLQGKTSVGEDFDVPTEVVNRFIPMVTQDMYDLYQEKGLQGLVEGLPAPFGVGVQTYGKQELKFGESPIGEETAQVRPIPGIAENIREKLFGKKPLGSSKSFNVETYFDQLGNLPREEAADIFDKIAKTNPDLAKQIADVVKDREKGITVHDKDLKSKGVASGDRAIAIKKDLDKLKTDKEKAQLWEEYMQKGVITEEVARQLTILSEK